MSKASLELGGGNWGTKNGNLLGYAKGSEAGRFVPREFSFTRGSDISATRINSSGLIEKYRENLLLQSNQFDTTWTLPNVSATSGQGGYDGTSDAWLITITSIQYSGRVQQNKTSSGVQTFSTYAKRGTLDGVILRVDSTSGNQEVVYNLTNGSVVSATGGVIDSSIESIGNDWYRIQFTFNTSITAVRIYPSTNTGNITTLGNIYIQDAQLEQGLVATSYLESGATTATSGVADNEPRIDYTGGTASLLLEPQRTNKVIQSEWVGAWSSSDVTLDFGYLSPDGSNNAYKITANGSQPYIVASAVNVLADDARSIWAKTTSGTGTAHLLTHNSNTNNLFTITNEWQRFDISSVTSTTGQNGFYGVDLRGSSSLTEILIWGAQCEEGSYPTSYIPTYGTSDTRAVDICNTSYVTTQSSMTYYVEFRVDSVDEEQQVFHLYNSSSLYGLGVTINHNGTNSGVLGIRGRNQSTTTDFGVTSFSGLTANTNYKLAFVVDWSNETITNVRLNTNSPDSSISARVTTINGLYLGSRVNSYFINGNIEQFLVFPTALTDAECITLTT